MIVRSHSKIRVDFIGPGEGLAAVSVLVDSKKILPERNRPNRNSLTSDLVGSVKDVDLMMMMRQKLDAQDQGRKMELTMMTSSAFDAYNTFYARILVSTTVTRNQATSNSRFFSQKLREDQSIAIRFMTAVFRVSWWSAAAGMSHLTIYSF